MFTLPDLTKASNSTRVQWAVIFLIAKFLSAYTFTAGVFYMFHYFLGTSITLLDILYVTIAAVLIELWRMKNLVKKEIENHMKLLQAKEELEKTIDKSLKILRRDLDRQTAEDGIQREIVEIEVRGKNYSIVVEFPEVDDREKAIDKIIHESFGGLVIGARLKRQDVQNQGQE